MALTTVGIDELVEVLNDRRGSGRHSQAGSAGICLLVGAGASVTAGISSAAGIVEKIAQRFPDSYYALLQRCGDVPPTYAQAMDALPPAAQVAVIRREIAQARINWAHLGIARLEAAGILDTIMTTNFDPLISRACALLNRFPAIYDLAALRDAGQRIGFEDSLVTGSAVYHLHGQYTGFVLLNSAAKLLKQAERIRPVLEAAMRGRTIIVSGYSGENDPLIEEIAKLNPCEHGLYWICHSVRDPHPDVAMRLLREPGSYVIRNQPADRFFWTLANKMNVAVPTIFVDPLAHTHSLLTSVQPYSEPVETPYRNIQLEAISALDLAIATDREARPHYHEIAGLIYGGHSEEVLERFGEVRRLSPGERRLVAWAAVVLGNAALKRAQQRSGSEETRAFDDALRQYRRAIAIHPKLYEAHKNLGFALQSRAQKRAADPQKDLEDSCAAFKEAARLHPDGASIYRAWGVSLLQLGNMSQGTEASRHFRSARVRLMKAIDLEPSNLDALKNMGNSFWFEGCQSTASKRKILQASAEKAYHTVEAALPGACAYNLACCYGSQGHAQQCADWLKVAAAKGQRQLTLPQIKKETDFNSVRQSAEFISALQQLFEPRADSLG